jgi:chromosome segregation ATPase
MDFSPDKIRARFHELTAERAKIDAKLNPLRAELDELAAADTKLSVKAARAREAKVRDQIKALQNQLFPIENERAACARALGGKTGEPE